MPQARRRTAPYSFPLLSIPNDLGCSLRNTSLPRVLCQNPAVADLDELSIPRRRGPVTEEIIGLTDEVCAKLLDPECASPARQVVAKLATSPTSRPPARKAPLPSGS